MGIGATRSSISFSILNCSTLTVSCSLICLHASMRVIRP
jgi:hypothetical protein